MPTVTIRNLDAGVVKHFKSRAKINHRSLEAELRLALADAARKPSTTDLRALAERIAAMTPAGVVQTDSTLLLREDRDR